MNSFSAQCKDTLHDIKGVSSKIIPVTGTFFGKTITFISTNPVVAVAVVAAVIVASLVIFAAYNHYQFHQQLKADIISFKIELDSVRLAKDLAVTKSKTFEKEKEYFKKEKTILKNKIIKIEKENTLNLANTTNDLTEVENDLKAVKADLNIADRLIDKMEVKIVFLEKKMIDNEIKALTEEERLIDIIESLKKKLKLMV